VDQGDSSRLVHARAVPWRGERPLVGHTGHRWPLALPCFPRQSPQRCARMPGSHASLAWRWRLVVATERTYKFSRERPPPVPPEVTDAGDPLSPARRGAVTSRGAPAPRASREVCAKDNGSHSPCLPRGRGPRVAFPPLPTPRPLPHPCHHRGHQTCALLTPRAALAARCQTSSSTRPARAQPDGTRRAPLEIAA
jgi:hypothetical protein